MPAGIQCWDENGNEVFNSNTRTLRFVESFSTGISMWTGIVRNSKITKNSILSGYRSYNGATHPVSIIAGNGFATYFTAAGLGSLVIYIYEY